MAVRRRSFARILLALSLAAFASSCSRSVSKHSSLQINIPKASNRLGLVVGGGGGTGTTVGVTNPNSTPTLPAATTANFNGWGLLVPTDIMDFTCYMVLVQATDLGGNHCVDSSGVELATPGVVGGMVAPGQTLSLSVPSGDARTIYLVGLRAVDATSCIPTASAAFARTAYSAPVIVAQQTVTLAPGDVQLAMTASLTDSHTISSCTGPAFSGQWGTSVQPTASLALSNFNASVNAIASGGNPVVLKLLTKDALGEPLSTGGLNVAFNYTSAVSTGTFTTVVDNGDGSYSASFSALKAGSPITFGATIGGQTFSGTLPQVTVSAGTPSATQSLISVSAVSVLAGGASTLKLTLYDDNLNLLGASGAGHMVYFSISGGTSKGTVSAATDNGDGTYSATFTGGTSGTPATVGATIDFAAVTSTLPTIQVNTGSYSLSQSTVTMSGGMGLVAGTPRSVVLTTRDSAGNPLSTGGLTVSLTATGPSTVSIGTATDMGDGTYTFNVTGLIAAGVSQIQGNIAGTALTSTPLPFTVSPGPISFSTSTVTVSSPMDAAGTPDLVTVVTKDLYGNPLNIGGGVVGFSYSGGSSTGSFAGVTDNADGTYTSVFTGVTAGSAITLHAAFNGIPLTGSTSTIQVTPGAPHHFVLSGPNSLLAGDCSTAYTAVLMDIGGNQTNATSNFTLTLSGAGGGLFYPNNSCTGAVTTLPVIIGTGLQTFYFSDAGVENVSLMVAGNGLSSNSFAVSIQPSLAWTGASGAPQWEATAALSAGGKRDHMFLIPNDVYVDASNFMYVVDSRNNRVVKFDPSGTFVGWIGQVQDSPLSGTAGCAGLGQGNTTPGWCLGGTAGKASAYPSNGGMQNPTGITGDGTYIYVVDNGDYRVHKYVASTGSFVGWIGRVSSPSPTAGYTGCTSTTNLGTPGWCVGGAASMGTGNASFNQPKGITFAAGYIYVTDLNYRVSKFDANTGAFMGWVGKIGTSPTGGGAGCPGATVGTVTTNWCTGGTAISGTADGAYADPAGIWSNGSFLFVVDSSNGRVQKINILNGASAGWIGRVATTPTSGAGCTALTSANATPNWCLGGTSAVNTASDGSFSFATGITGDGTYIYIMDGANRINRYSISTGTYSGWVGRIGPSAPTGGAAGCTGTTNAPTPGWCMGGLSAAGSADGELSFIGLTSNISGGFSNGTYLWTVDSANHRILKFNASTGSYIGWSGLKVAASSGIWNRTPGIHPMVSRVAESLSAIALPNATNFLSGSIFFTGSDLLVSDYGNNLVKKWNASSGTFGGWVGLVNYTPVAGAVGCSSTTNGSPTPGFCLGGLATPGTSNFAFNHPTGVTSDGTYAYVADATNNRVQKFNVSTGAYVGWIGRIITSPTGGAGGCAGATVGTFTPGWCTGGTATGGTADGNLATPLGITYSSGFIYVVDNSGRVSRFSATTGAFNGWIGKIATSPTGGAAGCAGATVGLAAPGWCTGGTTTTGTGDGHIQGNSVGLNADGSYLYIADAGNSRILRFSLTTGVYTGWIGKIATSPTAGASGCAGAAVASFTPGWCTGGTSTSAGGGLMPDGVFSQIGGVTSDGTYLYVTDANQYVNRVQRYNAATGAFMGWKGAVSISTPTGGDPGCTSMSAGQFTPGWCVGGLPIPSGQFGFDAPGGITFDANYLYVLDAGNTRVLRVPR